MVSVVRGFASGYVPVRAKRAVSSTSYRITRPVRRKVINPFTGGHGLTIVHVAHHRIGTVWFGKIMSLVARQFGLSFQRVVRDAAVPDAEVLLYNHSRLFERAHLESFRGSHLIRDPRDVVVSAYHYHLWTDEEWVNIPRAEYGGMTYQQYLRSLEPEAGIAEEIRRSAGSHLAEMGEWNYRQPEFLELKYEDVMADQASHFGQIFRHYGFKPAAVGRSVDVALRFSFPRVAGRSIGEVKEGSHLRSGKPGQWREVLSPQNMALFRELTGDLVERLGYV
jgi:Sulfotransferase domain